MRAMAAERFDATKINETITGIIAECVGPARDGKRSRPDPGGATRNQ
jgi:hypothetical protein